ncbi:MAG: hypothetical protein J2P37_21830, partial [Ktedonobacteraceae bacterium]|nr:hypothetical protein [Ktedonobacteraceae bacterium]
MFTASHTTIESWWRPLRLRLTLLYIAIAIGLLVLSGIGHTRLLQQVNQVVGGSVFNMDVWWQNYGLGLLAGLSWLLVGLYVLSTAYDWAGAVEGMTMLPPSILLLLFSHPGNVLQPDPADLVFQLLWIPACALPGAALFHLSLAHRPGALASVRGPRRSEIIPYLPLAAPLAYEWGGYFLNKGHAPLPVSLFLSLGYAVFATLLALGAGIRSLVLVGGQGSAPFPARLRHRVVDMLTLWIGGMGICAGVLLLLLSGQTFLSLPVFYTLMLVYSLVLLYAVRRSRLVDRLYMLLDQRDEGLYTQQNSLQELSQANAEQQRATSLLLRADARLRAILSQRIHDQPRQQALRIRSLLAHWQHKLRVESEGDPEGKAAVQPIIEALGRVRKISEELEGDLRGLQLLVEDVYQRRSLGIKLHLEQLIREDLPALHPESPLKIQADLWALDRLPLDLEQSEEGS